MKKIFTTLVAGLMISAQVLAVSVKDVCGQFNGNLWIEGDKYPSRSIYLLPGIVENTLTFVLPDFTFGNGKLGDIVLPNIQMDTNGKLTLDESTIWLDSISLRASIKMLQNFEDEGEIYNSIVSATEAQVTLEITEPTTLPQPIIVLFEGTGVRTNNYTLPNGGFEGEWTNNEPAGWHSFGSACGVLADFVKDDTFQFVQSDEVRPGSAGMHSALLSSKMMFGVRANGTCTNGRINAGSITAGDAEGNYNFSDPDSVDYNTPLNGRPDSLVFWAKYLPADRDMTNAENKARVSVAVTTDARYQDPETGLFGEAKIGAATLNYSAAMGFGWQRLSVPFEYGEGSDDKTSAYILATFTTNQNPGGGSSYQTSGENKVTVLDSIYLDDVELIYNRELNRFTINGETLTFNKHIAIVESNYCDDCVKYTAVANGRSAQSFIAFDVTHRCIFIYVIADDFAQSSTFSLYLVKFADSETSDLPEIYLFGENPRLYVNANPIEGEVSGGGIYTKWDNVTIEATANYGYHFVQWSDGVADNPRTFVISQDTTFTAEFAKNTYSIITESSNNEWGTTAGTTSALYLEQVEISATANYGYYFVGWNDGNTSNPRIIELTQDTTFTATFAPNTYHITKIANYEQGSISGSSQGEYLDEVTLTANPKYGYHFAQWSDGETENPRTFVLTKDTTFTAEFALDRTGTCGTDLALTWTYEPEEKVLTISGEGEFNANMQCGVEARSSLQKLVFANGVTSIGTSAFANCANLKTLVLSKDVKKINENAFYNCENLTAIYNYRPTPTNIYSNTFSGVDKFECILYVPDGSVAMYKSDGSNWKDFYSIEPMESAGDVCTVTYIDKDEVIINTESIKLHLPEAPEIIGFTFLKWVFVAGNVTNGLTIQAIYEADEPTSAPATFTNPANPAQKLIRNGSVYILTGNKTYTVTGQQLQ